MEIAELVKRLKDQENKGVLKKDSRFAKWSQEHMNKAESNLLSARIEYLLLTDKNIRDTSELLSKYDKFDWLIIKSFCPVKCQAFRIWSKCTGILAGVVIMHCTWDSLKPGWAVRELSLQLQLWLFYCSRVSVIPYVFH